LIEPSKLCIIRRLNSDLKFGIVDNFIYQNAHEKILIELITICIIEDSEYLKWSIKYAKKDFR